jgi:hypothetical protein
VASPSDPSSWTFTNAAGGFVVGWAATILAYKGAEFGAQVVDVHAGATTTATAPSVTTTKPYDLLIGAFGQSNAGTWTPPTGMTERVDINGQGGSLLVADKIADAIGSTGSQQATSSAGTYGVAQSVAILESKVAQITMAGTSTFVSNSGGATISFPAGIQIADIILAVVALVDNSTVSSAPSGFNLLIENYTVGDGNGLRQLIYYKIATGTEGGTSSSWSWSTSSYCAVIYAVYRGAKPIIAPRAGAGYIDDNTPEAPSVTTTSRSSLAVYAWGAVGPLFGGQLSVTDTASVATRASAWDFNLLVQTLLGDEPIPTPSNTTSRVANSPMGDTIGQTIILTPHFVGWGAAG